MKGDGDVLLISCYELGHQPLQVAAPAGFLRRAGYRPRLLDLSVEPHDTAAYARARFVGIAVPMHTALRVGAAAARRVREANPRAHVCLFGSYAVLNADWLRDTVADSVLGGELEEALVSLVAELERQPAGTHAGSADPVLRRLDFPPPARAGLPALERYARLWRDGTTVLAGAVEATRGCRHACRHCPLPAVYDGRFFAVPREVVLQDIDGLVAAGAGHVTFADADFLNGPTHARRIVHELHARHPGLSFDFTAKIEHLLAHRGLLPELAASGCAFVVSAVESLNDEVLRHLHKGHDRDDVFAALAATDAAGIPLRPSLMPFTPWETLRSYGELLDWIEAERLHEHVDPVQLSIRLLVPPGSLLLRDETMRPYLRAYEPENFRHRWEHPDPRMDRLHAGVDAIVTEAARSGQAPARTFEQIRAAHASVGGRSGGIATTPANSRRHPPRLTEPWFC
jgi:radical SAM superfamily enzyme YgiQ (UPF0313 family)